MPLANELASQNSGTEVAAILGSINATVTAAGTTLGTATALSAATNIVTTATQGQGVILPASKNVNDTINVGNHTTVNICVYPPTTAAKFNNGTAGVPVMMGPNTYCSFICINGTDWTVDAW